MALFAEFFGGKPSVPRFKPVNAQAEQAKAIQGNLDALPKLKEIGAETNQFNAEQLQILLRKMIPRYDEMVGRMSDNMASGLRGEIPEDVADAVFRNSAVRSLYGGYGGSGMARNLTARDLGLTSLDLTQRALDSATRWTAATSAALQPMMFNPSSMFVRPEFQAVFAQGERDAKFQRDYVKNQWDWYGSFGQQMVRFENTVVQLAAAVGGAAAGGAAAGGAMCWVAREVFGARNWKWLAFKTWLMNVAPGWFRNLYIAYGEQFAKWIADKPRLKSVIRRWMESRINSMKGEGSYAVV